MAARKQSKVTPKYKTKYRGRNWAEYEKGLRQRGDITVWFSEDAIKDWNAKPTGKPGGQTKYSDIAIVTALTLKNLFALPLRQTEGLLTSLLRLMGLELDVPDHTTLSRRGSKVEVPLHKGPQEESIELMIDSTGLKIVGDGEWHSEKHKKSQGRRKWRKLHIGVDAQGYIVASELTTSDEPDPSTVPTLLEQVTTEIEQFTADGAYDTQDVYGELEGAGTADINIVIPPRKTATRNPSAEGAWQQRDLAVQRIEKIGRKAWRKEAGANRQAHVENTMSRLKRITGDRLSAKNFETQKREAKIRVNILNRMIDLGMPEFYRVIS